MSMWRITIRTLHELGGKATTTEIARGSGFQAYEVGEELRYLKAMGMVEGGGTSGGRRGMATWALTECGVAYCEGRIAVVRDHDGQRKALGIRGTRMPRFVATWLSSLPKGIRIKQPEQPA